MLRSNELNLLAKFFVFLLIPVNTQEEFEEQKNLL